ncbi:MAG: SDR family oxidoreductase [Bryobacteraceae bacterium]
MKQRPILITGASGLLGGALATEYESMQVPIAALFGKADGDLRDPRIVEDIFARHRPSAVVHCAALTDVDRCETNAEEAWLVNVEISRQLAACAEVARARFAYISTDSVFDGSRGGWKEEDTPRPLNAYARSKLEGEKAVLRECPDALILRTNIYGWNRHARSRPKPSLAEWILERLDAGLEVPGFTDVRFSPILANHLAAPILELLREGHSGLLHMAGSWSGSKYEFATRVAETFGFDASEILPAKLAGAKLRAPRPLDTSLDVGKVCRTLGARLPGLDDGLRRFRVLRASRELVHV